LVQPLVILDTLMDRLQVIEGRSHVARNLLSYCVVVALFAGEWQPAFLVRTAVHYPLPRLTRCWELPVVIAHTLEWKGPVLVSPAERAAREV
jgi:hypothetical protein